MKGEAGHAQDDEYCHYRLYERAVVGHEAGCLRREAARGQGGERRADRILASL